MRRSLAMSGRAWSRFVLGVVAAATVIACAHPHEVPKPGESLPPSSSSPRPPVTTGANETRAVCTDAQRLSDEAINDLTTLLNQAQSAKNAGNQSAALTAITNAQQRAKQWSSSLKTLANKNIDSRVRSALNSGISTIDKLANTPLTGLASLDPEQVQRDITKFRDDLRSACS
jgi:hypothetical protein